MTVKIDQLLMEIGKLHMALTQAEVLLNEKDRTITLLREEIQQAKASQK